MNNKHKKSKQRNLPTSSWNQEENDNILSSAGSSEASTPRKKPLKAGLGVLAKPNKRFCTPLAEATEPAAPDQGSLRRPTYDYESDAPDDSDIER